ncbi:3-deoxy-D-manno-octulosonic acid transferase [Desulfospira joergensenii]|uniref:3-deoxy-D-manno-octulosonic acid transferase n=1 Tax=Desulfospira joergensenii TaxID=53329 RepID=UPI0003B770A0|nr:3-deoxy-D-manno-octulosonic acid transferase [Desulfospira joergensenii]
MNLVYHTILTLGFILVLPFLPLVWLFSTKRRANLIQRLGFNTGLKKKAARTRRIWIHALSVGEVRSALPLVQALADSVPGKGSLPPEIIFTASTKTGFETACSLFCSGKKTLVSRMGYFPFDLWFSILRVARIIEPDLVCLVETDYWPGFLNTMKRKKIPVLLVNARMSLSSLKGYARLGPLADLFFSSFSHVMAQTSLDRERFRSLGIPEDRITVVGNIKFDQRSLDMGEEKTARLKSRLGMGKEDSIFIAGSTHEGEETMILTAFGRLREKIPKLKLILAPRDPGRCKKLIDQIRKKEEFQPVFWSACQDGAGTGSSDSCSHDLILMDVMGILASSYAICDIAFIGGSLVKFGGHNPLEPAMFGKPVLFGPHMADFLEVAALLKQGRGAVEVCDAEDLAAALENILTHPELAGEMGRSNLRIFRENSGAVDRTIQIMEKAALV